MRPSIAAGPHRVLTIKVWHQTSGCKGTNFLREEEIGFHLAPAHIIVLGDADCLGNMEMTVSRKNLSSINSFFCKGIFNWLSDARYPVDVRRPAPVDNNIALSPSDAEIVSLIFKWVLTALLIAAGCIIVIRL